MNKNINIGTYKVTSYVAYCEEIIFTYDFIKFKYLTENFLTIKHTWKNHY